VGPRVGSDVAANENIQATAGKRTLVVKHIYQVIILRELISLPLGEGK
jgi:hypothetical protein